MNDLPSRKEQLDELVKEIQGKGRLSVAVCGDVSEEADVKILVTKVVEELGGLDVVRTLQQMHESYNLTSFR